MILNLKKLIKKYSLEINGCCHIGANNGNEYLLYKSLGIRPIIFIEALPHLYDMLNKNTNECKECININTAIGNQKGKISMYVETNGNRGSSSVLKPTKHLTQYPHIDISKEVEVDIDKLDNLDIPQVNFINIDIQGYELEAFKGSVKYLENVNYIISEVNRDYLYENASQVEDVDKFLNKFNFTRVETSWVGGNWGDALYIKNKKI